MEAELDKGPFFHGTKADLKVGELLEAGKNQTMANKLKRILFIFRRRWMRQSGVLNWR